MPDQQQPFGPAGNKGTDLFLFNVCPIRGTGDQQGVALVVQLFLKGLQPTGEHRVFHRRNNGPKGKRAFGRHHPRAEIWRITQRAHGFHHPVAGLCCHLIREVQTARNRGR